MSNSSHAGAPSPAVVVGDLPLAPGGRIPKHRHPVHQLVWAASGVVSVSAAGRVWVLPATRALWIPAGTDHAIEGGPAVARAVYVDRSPRGWHTPTVIAVTPLLRELAAHLAATADPDALTVPGTTHLLTGQRWRDHHAATYGTTPPGAGPGGAGPGGAGPGGADPGGADPGGADPGGADPGGADPGGADPGGTGASSAGPGAAGTARAAARRRAEAVLLDVLVPVATATIDVSLPVDPRALAVARALVADPSDGRGLAAWGREVGAGGRTLARLFAAETGMSFGRWRANARLRAALVLLAAGTPVSVVARRVGYSTPSAFIQAFRQALGVSPGAYF